MSCLYIAEFHSGKRTAFYKNYLLLLLRSTFEHGHVTPTWRSMSQTVGYLHCRQPRKTITKTRHILRQYWFSKTHCSQMQHNHDSNLSKQSQSYPLSSKACTPGVVVPCIDSHARWEVLYLTQVFISVFVWGGGNGGGGGGGGGGGVFCGVNIMCWLLFWYIRSTPSLPE